MTDWQPYLISFIIGLLVGIEREKAHPDHKAMGIRTFILISILGAIAGGIDQVWLSILVTAFTFGLILVSYYTQVIKSENGIDRGLTTEFAAGIIFCLSYGSHVYPALSALAGPVIAVILFSKPTLHKFTKSIKNSELEAALLLILGAVVVINLAPDRTIDQWNVFNPRKFGYLILTLGVLEFASYLLVKIIGEKKGSLLIGFLGGLVSSTAVLLSSSRQSKTQPERWRILLATTLAAKVAAFLELLLIIAMISQVLFLKILIPTLIAIIFLLVILFFLAKNEEQQNSELILKSPLDLIGVIRLSILLAVILALGTSAKNLFGEGGTYLVSLLTGLFELHGVSLANATMFSHGELSQEVASKSIIIAMIGSLFTKIGVSWIICKEKFSSILTAIFLVSAILIYVASLMSF